MSHQIYDKVQKAADAFSYSEGNPKLYLLNTLTDLTDHRLTKQQLPKALIRVRQDCKQAHFEITNATNEEEKKRAYVKYEHYVNLLLALQVYEDELDKQTRGCNVF